nr:penicillin acylase family protein [Oceanicoccus sp. KOV_DT_Chl]
MIKKILLGALIVIALGTTYVLQTFNAYQQAGEISLSALDQPVSVHRDELGIPYIYAETLADALRAQGFITGQNRLYQAELYKHLATGKLAEMFGERGLKSDILIRSLNIQQLAQQQIELLSEDSKNYYLYYLQGLNAYISEQQHEHPFSLSMLGIKPQPWTLLDIITVQYFQMWGSTANWRIELLAQQLIDQLGPQLANEISMVSVNPNDESVVAAKLLDDLQVSLTIDPELLAVIPDDVNAASNAWASAASKSTNGAALFSNSPHIDARTLPGFWHPMGIFTPELRAIGATAPAPRVWYCPYRAHQLWCH